MSLLLETTLGDVTIDLDVDGSPHLVRNVLKLAKCRYYTQSLVYNVRPNRLCQFGDPNGDGTGGTSIYGLIDAVQSNLRDVSASQRRFLKSDGQGRRELTSSELLDKGRLVMTEMNGVRDTLGSQLLLTVEGGGNPGDGRALDGERGRYFSVGMVVEDENGVLDKINGLYCDANGRPYADVRIKRCHVLDDPFDDMDGLDGVLAARGVVLESNALDDTDSSPSSAPRLATASPTWERPPEERVERRIGADVALAEEDDGITAEEREESLRKKEDKSRAVVLEMLGDLPSADIAAPEEVLFVCKLNPITDDEDLELIFARFDPNARAEIIRDPETGDSLCYAFVEFSSKEQCNEAYFKMNNALVDDRRIKVDFSQSVAKVWNKYTQRKRGGGGGGRGGGGGGSFNGGRGGGYQYQQGRGAGGRGRGGPPAGARQNRWGQRPPSPPPNQSNGNYYHQGHETGRSRRDEGPSRHGTGDSRHRRDDSRHHRHSPEEHRRRRSQSRSFERDERDRCRKRSRSPYDDERRRRRSRSRSRSRDRNHRKHHHKDHKKKDRHSSSRRDDDDDGRRRHERKEKKRRHRSRSRSRSRDRKKKSSRKHRSRSRSR